MRQPSAKKNALRETFEPLRPSLIKGQGGT
jgi:hypothetical protein